MPRVFNHRPAKTLIVGASGYGKSQFQIRAALASLARIKLVFDHKAEFQTLAGAVACHSPGEIEAALDTGWCVFDPHRMFPGKLPEAFRFFCDYAWTESERRGYTKLLVADELNILTESSNPPELCRVMEDGRSVALDVLFTSHGANTLHNRIRGQFTEVVTFFQRSKPAIETMEGEYDFDGELIRKLDRGEYIAQNLDSGRFQGGRVF
jgi:hypothetical protein